MYTNAKQDNILTNAHACMLIDGMLVVALYLARRHLVLLVLHLVLLHLVLLTWAVGMCVSYILFCSLGCLHDSTGLPRGALIIRGQMTQFIAKHTCTHVHIIMQTYTCTCGMHVIYTHK